MDFILQLLLCMCITISSLTPFSPLIYGMYNSSSYEVVDNTLDIEDTIQNSGSEKVEDNEYIIKNFITLDLEGYCTLDIPLSHFSVNSASTLVNKQLDYKDNKSSVIMGYTTELDNITDIPEYITKELAKVDAEIINSSSVSAETAEWTKLELSKGEDGCNVYIYYTTNDNKDSAFWMKIKVAQDSDNEEFKGVIASIINKYKLYVVSGTLFDTPNTGIYGDETISDDSANQIQQ